MLEASTPSEPRAAFLSKEIFKPNPDISIVMESKKHYSSFNEFCKQAPRFSIALDGTVNDGPKFDKEGPWMNIDHHKDVNRLATRSTAAQVEINLAQGLLKGFEKDGKPRANIFVNDCDEDMCLSLFLFRYAHVPEIIKHPMMSRLIEITDKLDTTGGMYPYTRDSSELKEESWVMEPYKKFMLTGGTAREYSSNEERDRAYLQVIEQVDGRIIRYLTGDAKEEIQEFKPDTSFNILYQDERKKWVVVDKLGAQGRTGMAFANIPAYVYLKPQDEKNGKFQYSIGRLSEFITYFDIPKIYELFNEAEGDNMHETNKWGGSSIIGGSPPEGSNLSPEKIVELITKFLSSDKK